MMSDPPTVATRSPAARANRDRAAGVVWACAGVMVSVVLLGAASANTAGDNAAPGASAAARTTPVRNTRQPAKADKPAPPAPRRVTAQAVSKADTGAAELASYTVRAARPVAETAAVPVAATPVELLHDVAAAPAARRTRVIRMQVTAYCACARCCGPDAQGITASGRSVRHNNGAFVAADTSLLPFGTKLEIPGYAAGRPVEVIDRGGAIKGRRLDVYFDSHAAALAWGRQWLDVTVVE